MRLTGFQFSLFLFQIMRKIKNVHRNDDPKKYQCFGCSPHNSEGLHLEFWEDGEYVLTNWMPEPKLMGWYNVLHGGIQATIMDEVAAWVVYVKCMTAGVTTELNVKYKKPVLIDKGVITVQGRLKEQNKRFAIIETQVISDNTICAEAEIKYFIFPEAVAKKEYHYPGIEAFFDE